MARRIINSLLFALVISFAPVPLSAAEPAAADVEFFEQRIRPVLVERCYSCHSADAKQQKKLKAELLLDTRDGSRTGGETGPAVVPNDIKRSLLVSALRHQGGLEMPPTGKLPDAVIADFVKWIETGATDPRDSTATKAAEINWEAAKRHWAFQPPILHAAPVVKNGAWPQRELDYFVLAALEAKGLRPVPPADPRTFIRRVTFDLLGLPPTAEEAEAILWGLWDI